MDASSLLDDQEKCNDLAEGSEALYGEARHDKRTHAPIPNARVLSNGKRQRDGAVLTFQRKHGLGS
jgi:hypothetical protein